MPAARPHPPPLWAAAVFAATLAALMLGTAATVALAPALGSRIAELAAAQRPDDGDHYLASDAGGPVDHHVLFFGLDAEALVRVRAADVLFLGNSRLMFALRPAVLRPFFANAGLHYYALGFGFGEGDKFPLTIIRKFDLRPRLVVVNSDGFFGGWLSEWAETVNRDTPYAARKLRWEAEVAHDARAALHEVAPHWLSLFGWPGLGQARTFNTYRSRFDGTWDIAPWPEATFGFQSPSSGGAPPGRGEVEAARTFFREMTARGSRVVLTRVPTPNPRPGGAPSAFAELLGVPLLEVALPGPATVDQSHLGAGSAHDWSRAVAKELAPHLAALASPASIR